MLIWAEYQLWLDKINPEILFEKGILKHADIVVKILGNGNINKPVEVKAHMFSKSAVEKLEKAGGKAIYQC